MQPNYSEEYKKQQESYQRSRDPFEYGQQVAQRRYSEIMAGLDAQRMGTTRSYSDMYQAARQRAVGSRAMGGPTLSGGMGQQRRDFVSALEMQELGKIGAARQQAEADLYAQSQSAFSNAQLEGQQAAQTELQNRQAALGLEQQRQAIMADKKLTDEQKRAQLTALGMAPEEIKPDKTTFGEALTQAGIYGGGALALGATGVKVTTGIAAIKAAGGIGAATSANIIAGAQLAGGGISGYAAAGLSAIPVWGWVALGVLAVGSLGYAYLASNDMI